MADGGEGTLDAFAAAVPGQADAGHRDRVRRVRRSARRGCCSRRRRGPRHRSRRARAHQRDRAARDASALRLTRTRADSARPSPRRSTTASTRLLLGDRLERSTDGGTGVLTALGARFTDAAGRPIAPGNAWPRGRRERRPLGLAPLPPGRGAVLSDVTNPLLGHAGAAAVFGPQKGATPARNRRARCRARRGSPRCWATRTRQHRAPGPRVAPASVCWRGAPA